MKIVHDKSILVGSTSKNAAKVYVRKKAPRDPDGVTIVELYDGEGKKTTVTLTGDEALSLGLNLIPCAAIASERLPQVLVE